MPEATSLIDSPSSSPFHYSLLPGSQDVVREYSAHSAKDSPLMYLGSPLVGVNGGARVTVVALCCSREGLRLSEPSAA